MERMEGKKLPALHFIRRQAAGIIRKILKGNSNHRAVGSFKSLLYKPSVISKKATYALVCQTLKYLSVIKEVLESAKVVDKKQNVELLYVLAHDLLFEKEILPTGDAERHLLSKKHDVRSTLVRLLVKRGATEIDDLLTSSHKVVVDIPRYARVNTLRCSVDEALEKLKKYKPQRDELLPDVLVFPSGTDLHDHPSVAEGIIFLQGKSSCIPAHVLQPEPDWEVLDACAAPGNKTAHLAALMNGQGRITACEMNKNRFKLLQNTIKRAGANNVEFLHQDFLRVDPNSPQFRKFRAILLDPSCSGSGTSVQRLDHLLPETDDHAAETKRRERLASFQKAALSHALSFPSVEKIVYSTCSLDQRENEDVIRSVLSQAQSESFELASALPEWPHRGLPVFDGAERCLRTDPVRDKMDGFFVALFVRKKEEDQDVEDSPSSESVPPVQKKKKKKKKMKKKKRERSSDDGAAQNKKKRN